MTFVRTRLALDRLAPGQTLLVLLRGEEPRRNVPRNRRRAGTCGAFAGDGADGVTRLLLIRRNGCPHPPEPGSALAQQQRVARRRA